MNSKWEYRGPVKPKIEESLKKAARTILKSERHRLKESWTKNGCKEDDLPPEWMDGEAWKRLVGLFNSEEGKAKSELMTKARKGIKTVSTMGRGGAAIKNQRMVSWHLICNSFGIRRGVLMCLNIYENCELLKP